jgi:hypothetical protein
MNGLDSDSFRTPIALDVYVCMLHHGTLLQLSFERCRRRCTQRMRQRVEAPHVKVLANQVDRLGFITLGLLNSALNRQHFGLRLAGPMSWISCGVVAGHAAAPVPI